MSLLFDIGELHAPGYARLKRADRRRAPPRSALPLLALVVPLVAIGNLFGNRGPLLFRQSRTGRNGREFEILKFRTMTPRATARARRPRSTTRASRRSAGSSDGPTSTSCPRCGTSCGATSRSSGRGPSSPTSSSSSSDKIPFYRLRHLVRPGLTGWAQVKYHYGADETDALEKLQYEFFYLRHQSLDLDLRIVVRTLRAVMGRTGR